MCSRAQGGPGACRQAGAAHAKSSPAFHKGGRSLKRSLGAAAEQSGGVKRKLSFWKLFCLIIFGLDLICRLLKCTKELWPDAFSVLCALAEPCKQAITLKVNFGLLILSLLLVLFPSPVPVFLSLFRGKPMQLLSSLKFVCLFFKLYIAKNNSVNYPNLLGCAPFPTVRHHNESWLGAFGLVQSLLL